MQYQEILALVNAGYSRAEIEAMQAQPAPVQPQGMTPQSSALPPQQIVQPVPQPAQPIQQPQAVQQTQEAGGADVQALLLALTRAAQAAQQPVHLIQPQPIQQPQPVQPIQQPQPVQPIQQPQPVQPIQPQAVQPIQQPQAVQQTQQAQAQPGQDAQQILRALGGLVAGVDLPMEAETLEDRMGNTLIKALGLKDKEEQTGGLNNGIK